MGALESPELQLNEATPAGVSLARPDTITWLVLLVIMAAIAAGIFGRGPVSRATATGESRRLSVDYERFERYRSLTRLSIVLDAREGESTVEIVVSSAYLDAVHLRRIAPAPLGERPVSGGVAYAFAPRGASPLSIQFDLQPIRQGRLHGTVAAGGDVVRWWQFIYP